MKGYVRNVLKSKRTETHSCESICDRQHHVGAYIIGLWLRKTDKSDRKGNNFLEYMSKIWKINEYCINELVFLFCSNRWYSIKVNFAYCLFQATENIVNLQNILKVLYQSVNSDTHRERERERERESRASLIRTPISRNPHHSDGWTITLLMVWTFSGYGHVNNSLNFSPPPPTSPTPTPNTPHTHTSSSSATIQLLLI